MDATKINITYRLENIAIKQVETKSQALIGFLFVTKWQRYMLLKMSNIFRTQKLETSKIGTRDNLYKHDD